MYRFPVYYLFTIFTYGTLPNRNVLHIPILAKTLTGSYSDLFASFHAGVDSMNIGAYVSIERKLRACLSAHGVTPRHDCSRISSSHSAAGADNSPTRGCYG